MFPVSQEAPSLSGKGTYQQRRITLSSLLLRVSPFLFHSSFTERTLQHQAWQPVVISLLFTASATHIRVLLIASHSASTKHSSRSSFASFFMSTTHHYGLLWSTHSRSVSVSRNIHATATSGSLLPAHLSSWVSYSFLIFFNQSIQYVKGSL